MITKKELKDAFVKLGVETGQILEVHSSLSSCGKLEGGADTVIDTLKELDGRTAVFFRDCPETT